MKVAQVFAVILAAIFAVKGIFTVQSWLEVVGWEKTAAVVSFIGMPDGAVFGTYTDSAGVIHEMTDGGSTTACTYVDEAGTTHIVKQGALYTDPFFQGNGHNNVESNYGKTVDVLYNPETFETRQFSLLILDTAVTAAGVAISAVFLILSFRIKKHSNKSNS